MSSSETSDAASGLRQLILNCERLPSRLTSEETAIVLGFSHHDIPVLMARALLTALGNPAPNAPKYFSAAAIVSHGGDPRWLDQATRALAEHWREKNTVNRNKLGLRNGVSARQRRSRYCP